MRCREWKGWKGKVYTLYISIPPNEFTTQLQKDTNITKFIVTLERGRLKCTSGVESTGQKEKCGDCRRDYRKGEGD